MLFLLASLAAAGAAPLPARTLEAAGKPVHGCVGPGITYAEVTARAHGLRRLGDEPAANQYLAVDRNVGGCPAPAVVRTGIRR
jgi:hypothetical protein